MKKFLITHKIGVWISILVIGLLPLFNFTHAGLPVSHDGKDHVARIANFYQSLTEGVIVPRWAGNLNWGYGHPILMFLYPLPSYIGSLFHFIGFSLVDSVKLVFALGFIVSVLTMYLFASTVFGVEAGVLAAVLYGFAPYRFVDMYVRGAIGEHVAFVFPPLVLLGLWKLAKEKSVSNVSMLLIVCGMAMLLLSHNAVSLMMMPIIGLYLVYLLWSEKLSFAFIYKSVGFLGLGFMLSAFFWLPAFVEGKYTLRDIVTKGEFTSRFVDFFDFFNPQWAYGTVHEISKFLGVSHILVIIFGLCIISRMPKVIKRFFIGITCLVGVSIVLMTPLSALIWRNVTLLQKFQFPWRFLHITTLLLPIVGAIVVFTLEAKKRRGVVILLSIIAIVSSFPMWQAKEYVHMPDADFTGIYNGTTDTGESAPIWSVRFMESRPSMPMYAIDGKNVHIRIDERKSTYHAYTVTSTTPVRMVENTLYFPNWEVYIDKKITPVEFQNPAYRGLMTFQVPEGTHTVAVLFSDTKLRTVANSISIVGFLTICIVLVTIPLWRKRK